MAEALLLKKSSTNGVVYGSSKRRSTSSNVSKNNKFTTNCASLVKEQRARIYILRRCATMLLCWYIQGSDD